MRVRFFRSVFVLGLILTAQAQAHISLVSPTPLMDGYALSRAALKVPPFGAPAVDIAAAPFTTVSAGDTIEVDVEVYVAHPGEIAILYTRDFEGEDVQPLYELASIEMPVPHANLLLQAASPMEKGQHFRAQVRLPDMEGDIVLVVRQVMRDKIAIDEATGTVDLSRVYYHQAAKLRLVK